MAMNESAFPTTEQEAKQLEKVWIQKHGKYLKDIADGLDKAIVEPEAAAWLCLQISKICDCTLTKIEGKQE